VRDEIAIAPVLQARCKPLGDPKPLLDIAKDKHAAIRRQHPAIERGAHFLAGDRWKRERQQGIFFHDGCGAPRSGDDSASQTES